MTFFKKRNFYKVNKNTIKIHSSNIPKGFSQKIHKPVSSKRYVENLPNWKFDEFEIQKSISFQSEINVPFE